MFYLGPYPSTMAPQHVAGQRRSLRVYHLVGYRVIEPIHQLDRLEGQRA